MTGDGVSFRERGTAWAFDSKYVEKGESSGKGPSFKPSKPANISRPQNVKMPPLPRSNKG
jgi:hypothetical protein